MWTQGWGHTGADVKPYAKITIDQAEQLLISDLKRFESCVNKLVKVDINQNEFDALCSFTFNLGCGALEQSTLLKKLNAGNDKEDVASEFGRWVLAGNQKLEGLVRRRDAEAQLFLKPVAASTRAWVIVAKQDTYFKKKPVQSSELDADQKLFVSKGSTWQWDDILMTKGSQHCKVGLVQKPDAVWFIFTDHWDIIRNS